ncbi:hypothetical protein llap_17369 [Limosa lapponica baueri]|uniref:Uncharacterized protein n=1 Tax=Limosa lapponica baueri TaxID=1758121 RepID=A0A2I0TEU5_LIMLA|nr:hypothetical protein llap_17369 [Limosa lapponica baueri]
MSRITVTLQQTVRIQASLKGVAKSPSETFGQAVNLSDFHRKGANENQALYLLVSHFKLPSAVNEYRDHFWNIGQVKSMAGKKDHTKHLHFGLTGTRRFCDCYILKIRQVLVQYIR